MDDSRQLRPATAVARCTVRRSHDRYSGEAVRGLWRAFLDEVSPYGGGAGRWTHLMGSWAATIEAACTIRCPSSSSSATMRASFSGALAHPRPPSASPWSPQASPRLQLRWAAAEIGARQQRLGQRWRLSLGPKYAQYRALFIGGFG
jgi:hypothetical protein